MKKPDWDRIQEMFCEARKLPRAERRAFVEKSTMGDTVLANEVLELLALDNPSFLDVPVANIPLAPATDYLLGTTINKRYLIEKELGRGGMSRVYFARDLKVNHKAVVIKVLSQELLGHRYARQKFEQEVEALSRIRHSGVVAVFDKGELRDGRPYFVMEFVDGETLRSEISSEGMNLERAAVILKQIGTALNQVHQQGVCHRDLKPENVLLMRDTDNVVLIDFGIAQIADSVHGPSTTKGHSAGTLMYMSPEQLRGEKVAPASDIYSMGVIAYEVVTGRRPFNITSPARLLELQKKRVRTKPRSLREDLPSKAETIILRALSFDSGARYARASEFGECLADALLASRVAPRKIWAKAARASLILIGIVLLSFAIYAFISTKGDREASRSFSYQLTVQKMRDGQPYQGTFKSNGDAIFENGDKFQLTVSSPVPAYLYIFNEGPPEPNNTSFAMIFPNQKVNKGSPSVGANQSVQSTWITFRGPAGAENFWIVWSTSPVGELDAATSEASRHPGGGLTGESLVTVKQYLTARESEINTTTYHYNSNQTAVVRGRRDLLVTLAQFKHR